MSMSVERGWLLELEALAAEMARVEARIDAIVARVLPSESVLDVDHDDDVR